MVRTLPAVQRVIIPDRRAFHLYGFDLMLDSALKAYLLEVNASPSLTAETPADFDLKFNILNDMLDIVDVEGRHGPHDTSDLVMARAFVAVAAMPHGISTLHTALQFAGVVGALTD